MPQLHFYVSDEVASAIQYRASQARMPVSKYLAEMVKKEIVQGWPEGWFDEVFGRWEGEPLQRAPQGEFDARAPLD